MEESSQEEHPPDLKDQSLPSNTNPPTWPNTATYLETLTSTLINLYFSAPTTCGASPLVRAHIHPDFVYHATNNNNERDNLLSAIHGRDEFFSVLPLTLQSERNTAIELTNVTALVHKRSRRAEVYFTVKGRGRAGFWREGVSVMYWERMEGVWRAYRHASLRGGGSFEGWWSAGSACRYAVASA